MKTLTSVVVALLIALSLGDGTTSAKERVTQFDVHVGDAFILGIGLAAVDTAGAPNGDTIELLFTGRIDTRRSRAEGDGGFRHFDKDGKLVDFGTFTAKQLISFLDLGPAAGLRRPFTGDVRKSWSRRSDRPKRSTQRSRSIANSAHRLLRHPISRRAPSSISRADPISMKP
jgi:hypothetical protein